MRKVFRFWFRFTDKFDEFEDKSSDPGDPGI